MGDPFTDSQEHPTSFRIGRSVVVGDKANVSVLLRWSARSSWGRDERNLEIQLVRVRGMWLINNIVNKDDGDDLVVHLKREKYLP